ncbi:MAG TPA: phospholipid carrier-dependent glycosyltransferase, partial [Patescibacteria group bacterium]|nr:phospholipid carrier-dependent glycosyltransferase [Patescibacteria group bacterium]
MMRRETLQSYLYLAVALLIIIGLIRIFSTYSVFWQTWDEPPHITAGMEWLETGQYTREHMHPPLPRVMCALGPYLDGVRSTGLDYRTYEGNNLLQYNNAYERNLTLARLGVLPFFVIATLVVWIWARLYFGGLTALLSVILFTTLPPVLAHSGLATTDMACAAT